MPVTAPALKAMSSAAREPLTGRIGDPHVGADRDVHADIAGSARKAGADEVADGDRPVENDEKNDRDDDADDGDRRVLAVEIGGAPS